MKLVFEEVFVDPAPFVEELKQTPIPTCPHVLSVWKSFKGGTLLAATSHASVKEGGRKPTNGPSGSGSSCRIRSTTPDGRTTSVLNSPSTRLQSFDRPDIGAACKDRW